MRSRDLYDLGVNPARYIRYPGGNSYYIDDSVEQAITAAGSGSTSDELDDIFWHFLKPEIRRKLEHFRRRELMSRSAKRRPHKDIEGSYHVFDKRRIYYLKCGRVDQSRLGLLPAKMFRVLNNKSRDEIEQKFIEMERILPITELKSYVYSIFDLQNFFTESFAKSSPHVLNQAKVDDYFLKEICRLNDDCVFWNGMEKADNLQEYLVRYAVMFFDFDYQPRSFIEAYIRNFINSRRDYRPPPQMRSVTLDEASTIFKASKEALGKMRRSDLARLYRRRAQKLHPDKGGDHDTFVKLTEAYHSLLSKKP
ncbi:MAG: J domain-containing protein [Deltaproteobacteria bacterium]|nr:MAG: J domain-containing protein [Deltaproteobacteria bacterium]